MDRDAWIYLKFLKGLDGPILDAGCNFGNLVNNAPEKFVGIDLNEENLKKARCKTVVADLEKKLPFPDGMFNAVTCTETLEHLDNTVEIVRELKRVLRPGGTLLISVPCYKYHLAYHFGHKRFFHEGRDIGILAKWTGLTVKELFEVRGIPRLVNLFGTSLGLLLAKLLPKLGFHGVVYAVLQKSG